MSLTAHIGRIERALVDAEALAAEGVRSRVNIVGAQVVTPAYLGLDLEPGGDAEVTLLAAGPGGPRARLGCLGRVRVTLVVGESSP